MKSGYLFATPPGQWWAKWICRILGARTFHWGMVVQKTSGGDWITTESIGKGTALSRLWGREIYLYRVKGLEEVKPKQIYEIHSAYGECHYDIEVYIHTAIWWLLRHYLGVIIPIVRDKKFHCQEWVCLLACELGVKIIPDDEYPICTNLENSPYLEYLGYGVFNV
jgi:hypothetical protein